MRPDGGNTGGLLEWDALTDSLSRARIRLAPCWGDTGGSLEWDAKCAKSLRKNIPVYFGIKQITFCKDCYIDARY